MSSSTTHRLALALAGVLAACGVASAPGPVPFPIPSQPGPTPIVVAQGGPGQLRHFPFAFSAGGGRTIVCWSEHMDAVLAGPVDACSALDGQPVRHPNFYLSGLASVGGVLIGESYITGATADPTVVTSYGWTSRNLGTTWEPRVGTVQLPQPGKVRDAGWGGLLFHRRLHALADGSIGGTMYGNYVSDGDWYRSVWVRSTDLGDHWGVASTIAAGPAGTEGHGEPVTTICPNSWILAVIRTGLGPSMRQTRSVDGGKTWERPQELGLAGWDPDLLATPHGVVLAYGEPDYVHIATSQDCGGSWQHLTDLHVPTSSGYSGLALVSGRLWVFTDTDRETAIRGYPVEFP